jgi:hypothetical protein
LGILESFKYIGNDTLGKEVAKACVNGIKKTSNDYVRKLTSQGCFDSILKYQGATEKEKAIAYAGKIVTSDKDAYVGYVSQSCLGILESFKYIGNDTLGNDVAKACINGFKNTRNDHVKRLTSQSCFDTVIKFSISETHKSLANMGKSVADDGSLDNSYVIKPCLDFMNNICDS